MSRLSATKAASTAAAEAKAARDIVVPHLVTARDAVAPAIGHARDTVLPALEHARKAVEEALKDDVLPRVAAGIAATEPARDEAVRRGSAAIAALRGQIEAPAPARVRIGHRVGKLLIVTAVGAAAVAAYRAWKLPHGGEDWVQADTFTSGAVPGTGADADKAPANDDIAVANGRPAGATTSGR